MDKQDRQNWTKDKMWTAGHQGTTGFANVADTKSRTLGGLEKDTGLASTAKGPQQQENN